MKSKLFRTAKILTTITAIKRYSNYHILWMAFWIILGFHSRYRRFGEYLAWLGYTTIIHWYWNSTGAHLTVLIFAWRLMIWDVILMLCLFGARRGKTGGACMKRPAGIRFRNPGNWLAQSQIADRYNSGSDRLHRWYRAIWNLSGVHSDPACASPTAQSDPARSIHNSACGLAER